MKVMLAIASYRGVQCAPLLNSLEQLDKLLTSKGVDRVLKMVIGSCYIQVARNELVYNFVNSDCDTLFFIDDDISFNAEDALKLIESKDDVIAGVYPLKQDIEGYPCVIRTRQDNTPVVRGDGCIMATHVPTGFLKVSRNAIEKLIAAYPQNKYTEIIDGEQTREMIDLFPQGVKNGRWWGEDFAFCNLWNDLLETIWIIPNITLKHHSQVKTVNGFQNKIYTGNYHEFLLRQPKPESN